MTCFMTILDNFSLETTIPRTNLFKEAFCLSRHNVQNKLIIMYFGQKFACQ